MLKKLAVIVLAAFAALACAQTNRFPPINWYAGDPTGTACTTASPILQSGTTGFIYTCNPNTLVYQQATGSASSGGLTVGSTTVASGTTGYVLIDNLGVLGNVPFDTASLSDWTDSGITNGNCPVWNSGTGKWTPGACGGTTTNPLTLKNALASPTSKTFNGAAAVTQNVIDPTVTGAQTMDGPLVLPQSITETSPVCDIRAYGAVIDNATDIGPYIQDCINVGNPSMVAGGSYTILLPCNTGTIGVGNGCYWANPEALTVSGQYVGVTLLLQGNIHLGAGLFPNNNISIIGAGGGQAVQFGSQTNITTIFAPNVSGTLGTAITVTNSQVQVTPTFTSGSIANMPPGSAITVAENTTVTGTLTGTRVTAEVGTYGLATLTLPSAGAQPRYLGAELLTVTGCSDTNFNISNGAIAAVDYGGSAGERVSYYITATGTGTATGCSITSFDDDKYETLRLFCSNGVEYGGGAATCGAGQFTVTPSFNHLSTAIWGAVAVGTDFASGSSPQTWKNIDILGCRGMCFWGEEQFAATMNNVQAEPSAYETAGTMEQTATWQARDVSNITLRTTAPSCSPTYGGQNCTQGSYPYALKCDNESYSIAYGSGNTGCAGYDFQSLFVNGGVKIGNKGGGVNYMPSEFDGYLDELPSIAGITIDNRHTVQSYTCLIVNNSALQDNYLNDFILYYVAYTDSTWPGNGCVRVENPSPIDAQPRNSYMNDAFALDPAPSTSAITLPINNSGPSGIYGDGIEFQAPVRGSGATFGAQILPFGSLAIDNSPSYWTSQCASNCTVTTTNVTCPDGTQATSQMLCAQITNPSSSVYANPITIGSWTGGTYAGDSFIYGCYVKPIVATHAVVWSSFGITNAPFVLNSAGTDTWANAYTGTSGSPQIATPSAFGTNLFNQDWYPQIAIATIGTGESTSHTINFNITIGTALSTAGAAGNEYSDCRWTFVPGPNNPSYAGATPADVMYARDNQYRGAVPDAAQTAGTAATREPIVAPTVNGVPLTITGGSSVYLNGAGGYTTPSGGGGGMVYPGAGVGNSTGSAWGTSYTVGTGNNDLLQLNSSAQIPAVSMALLTGMTSGQVTTALTYTPANCTAGTSGSDCLKLSSGLVPVANLPTGTSSAQGVLQTDGSTIANSSGTIACTTATTGQLGCVKPDGTTITISSGVISAVGAGGPAYNMLASQASSTSTTFVTTGLAFPQIPASATAVGYCFGNYENSSSSNATGFALNFSAAPTSWMVSGLAKTSGTAQVSGNCNSSCSAGTLASIASATPAAATSPAPINFNVEVVNGGTANTVTLYYDTTSGTAYLNPGTTCIWNVY